MLAPSSPHFYIPETHVSVPESINHQAREKHKTYQTVGWSFLRKTVRAFHFDLFFFFPFQKQTRKTSPPYKNNKAQSHTFQSSPENDLQ